jgi:hypothetical protein
LLAVLPLLTATPLLAETAVTWVLLLVATVPFGSKAISLLAVRAAVVELTTTAGEPAFFAEGPTGAFLATGDGGGATLGSTTMFAAAATRSDFAGPSVVLATVVPPGAVLSNFLFAPVPALAAPDAPAVLVCIPVPDAPAVL